MHLRVGVNSCVYVGNSVNVFAIGSVLVSTIVVLGVSADVMVGAAKRISVATVVVYEGVNVESVVTKLTSVEELVAIACSLEVMSVRIELRIGCAANGTGLTGYAGAPDQV